MPVGSIITKRAMTIGHRAHEDAFGGKSGQMQGVNEGARIRRAFWFDVAGVD